MSPKGAYRGSPSPKALWRRAALAAMRGKARALTLIAVLPVVFDDDLKTLAGNDWLMTETALDLRSVQYGLDDLKEAGLIKVEVRGPRRTIIAIIPPEHTTKKHEQIVHASDPAEGEQIVHANPAQEHEQSKRKARTSYSPIEGRSPPYPPRAPRNQFEMSKALAEERLRNPFKPGTPPSYLSEDELPTANADARGAGSAAAQAGTPSRQRAAR